MERQITFFQYEIGIQALVEAEDGRYDMVRKSVANIEASSLTKTEIRKALNAAGYETPRGTDVFAEKVGKVRYYFTTEDLKRIANRVEELPLTD